MMWLVAGRSKSVFTRILVPLDGSEVAEIALVHAAQMADIFNADLILLRATFLDEVPNFDLDKARLALINESETYLHEAAQTVQGHGRCVHTVVCWSKAAEAIIDYAVGQKVSVVVMATHGHSDPERWPIGSIAEKVLRSMQVPVLLVRAPSTSDKTK
jgi:nucleotide-binding universal stress UspA family protein